MSGVLLVAGGYVVSVALVWIAAATDGMPFIIFYGLGAASFGGLTIALGGAWRARGNRNAVSRRFARIAAASASLSNAITALSEDTPPHCSNNAASHTPPLSLEEVMSHCLNTLRRGQQCLDGISKELKTRRCRSQAFYTAAPLGLITWTNDLRIESWSDRADELYGLSPPDRDSILAIERKAQSFINRNKVSTCFVSCDMRGVYCQWHNVPLRENDGTVVGFISFIDDFTERKKADELIERMADRHRRLINAMQMIPRHPIIGGNDFKRSIAILNEFAVMSLEVEEASIWLLRDNDKDIFECIDLYAPFENGHQTAPPIKASEAPNYVQILRQLKTIEAPNISSSSAMADVAEHIKTSYQSHLGAPIILRGEVIGLLSIMSIEARNAWNAQDVAFANYIADVIGGLRQSELRLRTERELQALNETLEQKVAERTREAELKSSMLESTMNTISQGVSFFDRDWHLTVANDTFYKYLDLPKEKFGVGAKLEDLIRYKANRNEYGPGDAEQHIKQRMIMLPHHKAAHDYIRRRPNGTYLHVVGRPMPDSIGGFVHTYGDITDSVNAHHEAQAARSKAESANQALQDSLDTLKSTQDDLIQSEKLASLGGLVAGVAHEVNTPLGVGVTAASILGERFKILNDAYEAGTLDQDTFDQFITQAEPTLNMLTSNLSQAVTLVSSFKQVAVDQSSGDVRDIEVGPFVESVITSLKPKLRSTKVETIISVAKPIRICANAGALTQVLTNLIMNALIHGFNDGSIAGTIHINVEPSQSDTAAPGLTLTVADTGLGATPEVLKRLTEPFFTTRRGQGGSGLGLHIVHNLVVGPLKGHMSYRGAPNQGMAFTIDLPATPPTPEHGDSK